MYGKKIKKHENKSKCPPSLGTRNVRPCVLSSEKRRFPARLRNDTGKGGFEKGKETSVTERLGGGHREL